MAQEKSAAADKAPRDIYPDARPLNALQAARLAEMTGVSVRELAGQTVAALSDKLKWRIDPEHFLFRKVCGKVVKKVGGIEYPVPFATVIVEDTDCNLLGYFPPAWQWGWFFPLNCRREVLATVKTDKCGRFCVYVPRFDIDWILRWRRERHCFPNIFERPNIGELIDTPDPRGPFPPRPDPGPEFTRLTNLNASAAEALAGRGGRELAQRAAELQAYRVFGARVDSLGEASQRRAFAAEMPPPLSTEFQQALSDSGQVVAGKGTKAIDAVRGSIASQLGVSPKVFAQLDLDRFVGPFRRCFDTFVPEWHLIVDTPDITFRVTQDTNGDGTEETIYSESYFDVRWNAGPIPDVTLVASSAALESHLCDTPAVPCKDVPEILFAGLMPLTDPAYVNPADGYASRPNRPVGPPLLPAARPAARSPFLGTLQLYGCVNVPKAAFYRVMLSADNGANFSPVTGLSWNIYPIPPGPPHPVFADGLGWYPVLADPAAFHPAHLLLEWPTPLLGKHLLKLELANAAKASLGIASNVVAVQVDNTAPEVIVNRLAWKFTTESDAAFALPGRNLLVNCPTIRRGAPPREIQVQFDVSVSAHHLRDAYLSAGDCGGGSFELISPPGNASHWHQTVFDNAVLLSGRFELAAAALEGAYGFGYRANSRAMNPAGGDGGHLLDWLYDPVYAYAQHEIKVAVVNG